MDLGKVLFGKHPANRRQKEMKDLRLGIILGVISCIIIGLMIYTLYIQGRL
jgi:hypothetical protein